MPILNLYFSFQGGLTATSMVRVNVQDVNDNSPIFSPQVSVIDLLVN